MIVISLSLSKFWETSSMFKFQNNWQDTREAWRQNTENKNQIKIWRKFCICKYPSWHYFQLLSYFQCIVNLHFLRSKDCNFWYETRTRLDYNTDFLRKIWIQHDITRNWHKITHFCLFLIKKKIMQLLCNIFINDMTWHANRNCQPYVVSVHEKIRQSTYRHMNDWMLWDPREPHQI